MPIWVVKFIKLNLYTLVCVCVSVFHLKAKERDWLAD